MILEKIVEKIRKEQDMDIREFRRSLLFLRLDNNDIDEIIREMNRQGIIKIHRNRKAGDRVRYKGR